MFQQRIANSHSTIQTKLVARELRSSLCLLTYSPPLAAAPYHQCTFTSQDSREGHYISSLRRESCRVRKPNFIFVNLPFFQNIHVSSIKILAFTATDTCKMLWLLSPISKCTELLFWYNWKETLRNKPSNVFCSAN